MSDTALQLLPTLLALPTEDREMLARELIATLAPSDNDEEMEFIAMLERRSAEMERDPTRQLDARQALESLRKKTG